MLVRSRFPEDGDHTGGDVSPSVSRVTNRDSSRGPLVSDTIPSCLSKHPRRQRCAVVRRAGGFRPRKRELERIEVHVIRENKVQAGLSQRDQQRQGKKTSDVTR